MTERKWPNNQIEKGEVKPWPPLRTADDYERSIREKVHAANILTPGEWVYMIGCLQDARDDATTADNE